MTARDYDPIAIRTVLRERGEYFPSGYAPALAERAGASADSLLIHNLSVAISG